MRFGKTFRSLKYRNFRLFFIGQGVSLIGTWMARLAIPWIIYKWSKSSTMLGISGFVSQIPTLIFSPIAGVVSDRYEKLRLLLITQIAAMCTSFLLAILVVLYTKNIYSVIAFGAVFGVINAFEMPARQSLLIRMIDEERDLGNAIALNSLMVNATRLIGPALAGAIIAGGGEALCFVINGVSFLFVIASLLLMRLPQEKKAGGKLKMRKDIQDGLLYVVRTPILLNTFTILTAISFMGALYTVILPPFVEDVLMRGPGTFGALVGASGAGALAGATVLASLDLTAETLSRRVLPTSSLVFSIGLILLSISRTLYLSMTFILIASAGFMFVLAGSNTLIQTVTDDEKRGRVMSLYAISFMGVVPFANFIGGWLGTHIGVAYTIGTAGILSLIVTILSMPKNRCLKVAMEQNKILDNGSETMKDSL